MAARKHPRRAAARAAAGRAVPSGRRADGKPRSIREQMETHRRNPACAVCHVRMDPLGFSLENFDALGQVADDGRRHADRYVRGASRRHEVRRQSQACVGCSPITRRTSRGRSRRGCWRMRSAAASKPQTSPRSGESQTQSAAGSYRWSSLIMGIVKSTPFTMSTARTADAAPVSTAAP